MEEKNKDKKNIIIGILIVIILLLIGTIVVMVLFKDKKPTTNGTTTTTEVVGNETTTTGVGRTTVATTTAPTVKFDYDEKLTKELRGIYTADRTLVDQRLGLYKSISATEDEAHYIIRIQYAYGDASHQRVVDLHNLYAIEKEDGKTFKELLNENRQAFSNYINQDVKKTAIFDYKYYLAENDESIETKNIAYGIYDTSWNKLYDLNAISGTSFSFKDTGKPVLNKTYYEIQDNKILYFAQQDCKNHPDEVDLMSLTIEDGKVKVVKEKTYDLTKNEITGAGAAC